MSSLRCETNQLIVSRDLEFDERFPDGEKTIYFQRVIYERFSPFLKKNGLVKRLRQFDDLEYTDELKCWEWYQQRKDRLTHIEYDLKANAIVEHYATGRNDYLKCERTNHSWSIFSFILISPSMQCTREVLNQCNQKYSNITRILAQTV